MKKKNIYFKINNGDKKIALTGYINKISEPKTDPSSMSFLLKNKKNFLTKNIIKNYQITLIMNI